MYRRTRKCDSFLFSFGKSEVQKWQWLQQTYGDELEVKRRTVYMYEWFKKLKEWRTSTELILHGGRPSSSNTEINVNMIAAIVKEDGTLTV